MRQFDQLLAGDDLRSLGNTGLVVATIKTQNEFDRLFPLIFHENRMVVMRAADAIEKISITRPVYLSKYKKQLLGLCDAATNKELKWHLALLLPRLQLINKEFDKAWNMLRRWAKDSANSRIVRVNAIQALFELTCQNPAKRKKISRLLLEINKENIPSLNARIRKISKVLEVKAKSRASYRHQAFEAGF
ncbi:MAG TPA: hypothetical protein VFX58_00155 [Chitinophagaceae bacterium]|nr:hypothetical protein [Chitinophagaceae bacterium]